MQKEILGTEVFCLHSSSIHLNLGCVFVTGITLEFGVFLVPGRFW